MESNLLSMAQEFSGLPMEALIGGPLNAAANANASMAMTQTKFMLDTCFTVTPVAKADAKPATGTPGQPGYTPAVPAVPKDYNNYKPIMVIMSLERGVITPGTPAKPAVGTQGQPGYVPAVDAVPTSIQTVTTAFNLPLLTIIPLNSLAVETVDITFEMEVKSSFSEEQTDTSEKEVKAATEFEAKFSAGPFSVSVKGNASYDQKDSSTHNTHYQKSNSAKYTVNVHAGQLPLPKGVNTIIEAFTNSIQPITVPMVSAN